MSPSKIIVFASFLFQVNSRAFSQDAIMIHQGEIEFERRLNAFAILDQYYSTDAATGGAQFAQQYKAANPQFKISRFILSFNDDLSYYAPGPADQAKPNPFLSTLAESNIVYSDLKAKTAVTEKSIFGKPYLIGDSIRKIHWKITSEIKMIAGFSCRRANAIIMDSVYVVAFYTDEIVPRGGPESFTGLPGMILGIALPYDHTTWFATRVSLKPVSNAHFRSPTGEKKISNRELKDILTNDPTIKTNQQKQDLYFHKLLL